MTSLADESNFESPLEDEFVWEYQTIIDGENGTKTIHWTPYSNVVSAAIEEAYKNGLPEILINSNDCIDLKRYVQYHISIAHEHRCVRRRRNRLPSPRGVVEENENESARRERFTSPLGFVKSCSCTADTTYYGSPFVYNWLLMFTEGKMTVTFDCIFPALLKGLIEEGRTDPKNKVSVVEEALITTERETRGKRSKDRIRALQSCCGKLYTKDCYVYRVVNTALRTNDQTKLYCLGPYCYLLFNYIGQYSKASPSTFHRVWRSIHQNKTRSVTLYRGDHNSSITVEEYRQAVGDKTKRFKWLPFVSTSADPAIADRFAGDVLYIIEMRSFSSNEDQLTDLADISHYDTEKEILLLPGVQFQVTKLDYDNKNGRHVVHIKMNSSYISKLI